MRSYLNGSHSFDQNLKFKSHLDQVVKKGTKFGVAIAGIAKSTWGPEYKYLKRLYTAVATPRMAGRLQKSTNDGANPKASHGTTTSNDSDHRVSQNHIHLSTRSRNGNPSTKIAPAQQNPQNRYSNVNISQITPNKQVDKTSCEQRELQTSIKPRKPRKTIPRIHEEKHGKDPTLHKTAMVDTQCGNTYRQLESGS